MTSYNREIECKFTVEGKTYEEALAILKNHYTCVCDATSYDLYWKAPGVDFVRLRENSRELTVKVTDKGTVTDRIEENVVIERKSLKDCVRLNTLLHGDPMKLVKDFSVFKVTNYAGWSSVVVCLYKVNEDPKQRVFLEVEDSDKDIVEEEVQYLATELRLNLTPVPYSLYQIFTENL